LALRFTLLAATRGKSQIQTCFDSRVLWGDYGYPRQILNTAFYRFTVLQALQAVLQGHTRMALS